MTINKTQDQNTLTLQVEGRLDTVTAPELEAEIKGGLDGAAKLVFDFGRLECISSAGLRVLLTAQKAMNKQGGEMTVTGCSEDILDIFEITGFSQILTVE